ncbi:hypothetical protein VN12_16305 [Pirellula sp. SH-Sr6A]|uniref:hypothetical protein n=1 Tax=Pirellula sp. SH-Sr6A TaxID=1632865 RepID=UPI00078B3E5E|nr:hypothetical protein [Pirellula sp. SH-Sr6A]AMV33692.1 hypothetical protein VN12_16305 [Pirellula sp. SH-Sr6A]
MELNSTQFWERLEQSGLVTPEQATQWREDIEQSVGGANLLHPNKVASELIRTGRITPFQFNALLEPTVPRLRVGPYLLQDTLSDRLGPNWYEAIESIRNKNKWAFALSPEQLSSDAIRANPPSIEWGRLHARLEAPGLDRWEATLLEPGILAVFCDPISGDSLSNKLASAPIDFAPSIAWIRSLAASLGRLHSNQLVHGWLAPEAVWISSNGEATLRRDPIFPPCSPYHCDSISCLALDNVARFGSASPELSLPDYLPDPSCDLYALGVLWATMLLGKSPWPNSHRLDKAGWRKTHQQVLLELPPSIPENVRRCIHHLVAKNRPARFPSVDSLLKQLDSLTDKVKLVTSPNDSVAPARLAPSPRESTTPVQSATSPKESNTAAKPASSQKVSAAPTQRATSPKDTTSQTQPATKSSDSVTPSKLAPSAKVSATPTQPTPSPRDSATPTKPAALPKESPTLAQPAAAPKESAAPAQPETSPRNPSAPRPPTGTRSALVHKKRKRKPKWVLPALGIGSVVLLGGLIAVLLQSGGSPVPRPEPEVKIVEVPSNSGASPSSSNTNTTTAPSDPLAEFYTVVKDDGTSLWAPPHAGVPYSIDMFPPGPEALVYFSTDAWTGKGPFQSIQPWVLETLPDWKRLIDSVPFAKDDSISQVAIALYPKSGSEVFEIALRFHLENAKTVESLLEKLPGFEASPLPNEPKQGVWTNGEWSIAIEGLSLDKAYSTKKLTVAPKQLVQTLVEIGGRSVPLRRQMDMLLQSSDSRSDLFILAAPSFLWGEGRSLFRQTPRLQSLAQGLWGDEVQAVSFTCTASTELYGEWRAALSDSTLLGRKAAELKQALTTAPDYLEQQLIAAPPPAYWRAIALRMPQMVRAVMNNSRFGLEDGQIVSNVYLPPESLGNLAVGVWMNLQNSSEGSPAIAAQPKPQPKPENVEDLLDRPISIAFEQESLEMGLAAIASEFNDSVLKGSPPVNFTINGGAFQKDGITQNQQVRAFNQNGIPLRTVLTDLVRRANPVTTVQSPTEKDQKVVWVLVEDPNSLGGKRIELTTRTWAETNGVTLPKEFTP